MKKEANISRRSFCKKTLHSVIAVGGTLALGSIITSCDDIPEFHCELCIICRECYEVCPVHCILFIENCEDPCSFCGPYINEDECIGCGACVEACPTEAISY